MVSVLYPTKGLLMFKLQLGCIIRHLAFVLHASHPKVSQLKSLVAADTLDGWGTVYYYRRVNLWFFNITYEFINNNPKLMMRIM